MYLMKTKSFPQGFSAGNLRRHLIEQCSLAQQPWRGLVTSSLIEHMQDSFFCGCIPHRVFRRVNDLNGRTGDKKQCFVTWCLKFNHPSTRIQYHSSCAGSH